MTVVDVLLKKRGLVKAAAIKEFFSPAKPQKISLQAAGIKPGGIDRAVGIIRRTVKSRRPIYVYGDYDADGISATAVLWEALDQLKAQVLPYISGRNEPVRGLSVKGLKAIGGKPLVITVDNGITGFEAAKYAKKNGIDLIITDHHQPKQEKDKTVWPEAAAIVHTDRLAGVGVAWFLAREVLRHLRGERSSHLGGDA